MSFELFGKNPTMNILHLKMVGKYLNTEAAIHKCSYVLLNFYQNPGKILETQLLILNIFHSLHYFSIIYLIVINFEHFSECFYLIKRNLRDTFNNNENKICMDLYLACPEMPFSKNSCHVVPSQFDWFLYNTSFTERYFSIISIITTLAVRALIVRKMQHGFDLSDFVNSP